jgi:hypothetical protein
MQRVRQGYVSSAPAPHDALMPYCGALKPPGGGIVSAAARLAIRQRKTPMMSVFSDILSGFPNSKGSVTIATQQIFC